MPIIAVGGTTTNTSFTLPGKTMLKRAEVINHLDGKRLQHFATKIKHQGVHMLGDARLSCSH